MMQDEDFDPRDGLHGLVARLSKLLIGLGSRLLVHSGSLILAAVICGATYLPGAGAATTAALFFTLYTGFVCLVPRGMGMRPDWLIPSVTGLLLIALWQFAGFPWQISVIWGGALTWSVRLLTKRGMVDWEWSAIPALLFGLFCFYNALLPRAPGSPPYLLFPVLAACGWGAVLLHARLFGDTVQAGVLKEACSRLEQLAAAPLRLPRELEPVTRTLAAQGRELLRLKPKPDASTAELTSMLDQISGKLARSGATLTPERSAKVLPQLERMSRVLDERLAEIAPPAPESPQRAEQRALAARLDAFRAAIRQLADKSRALPPGLQQHVNGIAAAADRIIQCMREDHNDVARGDRFLSRYLASAHTVIDEYTRLSARGGQYGQIAEALEKAEGPLARLEAAFTDEHAALLRNDTINFTAELNVLDKLLKMDGK